MTEQSKRNAVTPLTPTPQCVISLLAPPCICPSVPLLLLMMEGQKADECRYEGETKPYLIPELKGGGERKKEGKKRLHHSLFTWGVRGQQWYGEGEGVRGREREKKKKRKKDWESKKEKECSLVNRISCQWDDQAKKKKKQHRKI